jgi:hypothetical protein
MQGPFDYTSIEVNKQGKKSEKQIDEIKSAVNPMTWLWGGVIIFGIGGCFYFILSTLAGGGGGIVGMFVWILGIAGLFVLLRGLTIWNLRRKLLSEPLQTADGTVKIIGAGNILTELVGAAHYGAETYEGKELHPLGLAGSYPHLPPGDYRFYFLKTRAWLLAAEPLFDEAEMRATVNDLIASAFGYDQTYLENCRLEAKLGQLKTIEGLPKVETVGGGGDSESGYQEPDYFFNLGEFRTQTSGSVAGCIYEGLSYRAYYREGPPIQLVALEVA